MDPNVNPRMAQSGQAAPYGKSCVNCSRAKCKCFYRPDGPGCERCHRLGRTCEPLNSIRKRKNRIVSSKSSTTRDIALRKPPVQLASNQSTRGDSPATTDSLKSSNIDTQASSSTASEPETTSTVGIPDLDLNTKAGMLHIVRPGVDLENPRVGSKDTTSLLLADMAAIFIPYEQAEEQLKMFRELFIPIFPFVVIDCSLSAKDLRLRNPFLWLVIMALTTRFVEQQFAIEEVIWRIISARIVCQHACSLDLLLGVICFASWSHHFKQDKPFMTMLTQLAVSVAFELDLHKDESTSNKRNRRSAPSTKQTFAQSFVRTMEERRTMLALYHLSSATWNAYNKTEPLAWTSYLSDCLRVIAETPETELDLLLAIQVKCLIITNRLTTTPVDGSYSPSDADFVRSPLLANVLAQLGQIRDTVPTELASNRIVSFYLWNAEIVIRERLMPVPNPQDSAGVPHSARLEDLEMLLIAVERWLQIRNDMPIAHWVGSSVDCISHFMHCLVVAFKLTASDEPGWDREKTRKRADVLAILDAACETMDEIPPSWQMIDASGPRKGFFFKTKYLFQAMKILFIEELEKRGVPLSTQPSEPRFPDISLDFTELMPFPDDFLLQVAEEPWMYEIYHSSWDLGAENRYIFAPNG